MCWMIAGVLVAVLLILIIIVCIRTLLFVPKKCKIEKAEAIELNEEKIVADMADMVRCKTISDRDETKVDRQEFIKFEEFNINN